MALMKRARLLAFVPLFAAALAGAQYPGAVPPPADVKPGFDRITIEEAKKHLGYLAGPECAGRGTGQPGYQKAAEYVAARFKEYGLKPVGAGGTYFQNVPFFSSGFVQEGSEIIVGNRRAPGNGFTMTNLRDSLDLKGRLVVLDITGSRLDLTGTDLEGAIVVVRGQFEGRTRVGIQTGIQRAKAAVVLYETDKLPASEPSVNRNRPGRSVRIPSGYILKDTTDAMLASTTMAAMKFEGDDKPAKGTASDGTIQLVAKSENKEIGVPNVVGLLEGSDPTLKAEIVGIGAHLDHLGVVDGVTYWGADDDGSGSTALIQVAAAFSKNPTKPKRSILFMAFCGEEKGLIGSGYYSDNPIFPHDKMIAELQMDMVGRDSDGVQNGDASRVDKKEENLDTMRLVGSKRISTELDKAIQDLNTKYIGFKFKYDSEDVYTRSDHYNFAKVGIPIAFLFDGFHPEYHKPTDTIEKINFTKLTSAARLFYLTAMQLANTEARPKKDVKGG